jgi:hypothetical protein
MGGAVRLTDRDEMFRDELFPVSGRRCQQRTFNLLYRRLKLRLLFFARSCQCFEDSTHAFISPKQAVRRLAMSGFLQASGAGTAPAFLRLRSHGPPIQEASRPLHEGTSQKTRQGS